MDDSEFPSVKHAIERYRRKRRIIVIVSGLWAAFIVGMIIAAALALIPPAYSDEPQRWILIKIYNHVYSAETACMLDLEQAANMSPAGTKFRCERIK